MIYEVIKGFGRIARGRAQKRRTNREESVKNWVCHYTHASVKHSIIYFLSLPRVHECPLLEVYQANYIELEREKKPKSLTLHLELHASLALFESSAVLRLVISCCVTSLRRSRYDLGAPIHPRAYDFRLLRALVARGAAPFAAAAATDFCSAV